MSSIGLDPVESADFDDHVARNPGALSDPWFTWKTFETPITGLAAAMDNSALTLEETATPALRPIAQSIDDATGSNLTGWLDQQQRMTRDAALNVQPDARTVGMAGEIVHSLFQYGGEVALGSALGGPAGAVALTGVAEGMAKYRKLINDGVDPDTAAQLAGVEGLTAGASAVIPLVGKTFASSALRGAVLMPYMNAWQRGVTHQVLDNAGYHDMAQQYQMLDGNAILTDAAMGALFGGLGHALHGTSPAESYPTLTDAVLTSQDALHAESIGPGIPADGFTRNANIEALAKASGDVLADRPVDVTDQVRGATFVPDPGAREFQAEATQAFRESDAGGLAAELEKPTLPPISVGPASGALGSVGRARAAIDPEADSIAVAIAKLGGLNRDEVAAEWGSSVMDDAKDLNRLAPFGKPAIRKTGGLPIDTMGEALAERGYLPVDEHGKYDPNTLYDALRSEVAGDRVYTARGQEAQARRMAAERALQESDLPVTNDAGEQVTAREAFAQLQVDRVENERQQRMVEAAASCEGALL